MEVSNYEAAKAAAVTALAEIDPLQPFGTPLFEGLTRVTVSACIECIAMRVVGLALEVYLTKRSDDEAYGGMWHCPGTYIRPGETWEKALARMAPREFGCAVAGFRLAGLYNQPHELRGHLTGHVLIVELDGEPCHPNGGWYPIDRMPRTTVDSHLTFIPKVAQVFLRVTEPVFTLELP